jgi:hypothetical protein
MNRVAVILVALVNGLAGTAVLADDVTLESVPPVVVKTVPEAGAAESGPEADRDQGHV